MHSTQTQFVKIYQRTLSRKSILKKKQIVNYRNLKNDIKGTERKREIKEEPDEKLLIVKKKKFYLKKEMFK